MESKYKKDKLRPSIILLCIDIFSVYLCNTWALALIRLFLFFSGVRMGRIPKSIKEKALAEHVPPSTENEDPTQTLPFRVPPISSNFRNSTPTSTTVNLNLSILDEHLLFTNLDSLPIDHGLKYALSPLLTSAILPSGHGYELSDNFSIDETQHNDENGNNKRIVTLNLSALTNFMSNCDEHFANNAIERMKTIVQKISHPTMFKELDYNESSFIRYLRWKMFDLNSKYNGGTRQLIERMNSMIHLGVCYHYFFSFIILIKISILIRSIIFQEIPHHYKTFGLD